MIDKNVSNEFQENGVVLLKQVIDLEEKLEIVRNNKNSVVKYGVRTYA